MASDAKDRLGLHALLARPDGFVASAKVSNHQRDGLMRVDGNEGGAPNYSPNGRGGPVADPRAAEAPASLSGKTGRTEYPKANRDDDFEQAGLLYRVLKEDERARLVANIVGHLSAAGKDIQRRQLQHFVKADAEYGARVAKGLGLEVETARTR